AAMVSRLSAGIPISICMGGPFFGRLYPIGAAVPSGQAVGQRPTPENGRLFWETIGSLALFRAAGRAHVPCCGRCPSAKGPQQSVGEAARSSEREPQADLGSEERQAERLLFAADLHDWSW